MLSSEARLPQILRAPEAFPLLQWRQPLPPLSQQDPQPHLHTDRAGTGSEAARGPGGQPRLRPDSQPSSKRETPEADTRSRDASRMSVPGQTSVS